MNALEVLKQDHQKVKGLFQEARRGPDQNKRKDLFDKIDTELEIHAHIEETVFYPALEQHEELADMVAEALEERLDALLLQEALATKEESREVAREGRPGRETAEAFNGVAWHALFARKFEKALAAADRALALNPNDLMPETNRAHALMFLGADRSSQGTLSHQQGQASVERG